MLMFDLYLISILDSIIGVCVLFTIIGFCALFAIIVCTVLNKNCDPENRYDARCIATNNYVIKIAKPFLYVGIIALILSIFVPNTKQGYMIYGVGNTIEYLKSNDTAKQLPDKAVLALDKFLDKYVEESPESEEQEE